MLWSILNIRRIKVYMRDDGIKLSDITGDAATNKVESINTRGSIDNNRVQDGIDSDGSKQENKQVNIKRRKEKKKIGKLGIFIRVVLGLVGISLIGLSVYGYKVRQDINEGIYQEANSLYADGRYDEAMEVYKSIKGYKDAEDKMGECMYEMNLIVYDMAMGLKEEGRYTEAIELLTEIADFDDSSEQIEECMDIRREEYIELIGDKVYKLNKYKELAVSLCTVISTEWNNAVLNGQDATVALQGVYSSQASNINTIKVANTGLEEQIGEIDILDDARDAYDMMISLYDIYKEISEQVLAPSGKNTDYMSMINGYSVEFDSLLSKLYTKETGVKEKVRLEVEKQELVEKEQADKLIGG